MFVTRSDISLKEARGPVPETNWINTTSDYAEIARCWAAQDRLRRPLRVAMLGMRGFPNVQGGVEKHAERLAAELVALGCDVTAIVRSCHVPRAQRNWQTIRLVRVWAPHIKGAEAFIHSFLGVLYAAISRPDILHIHGIGPALFTPLARAMGLRVVVTHHLPNYENEKWGLIGRFILRSGEWAGMKFANARIAVSEVMAEQIARAYQLPITAIPNGIDKPQITLSTETLDAFGLSPGRYFISVARIDEQKRQLDLVAAYARLRSPHWKLALVGDADYTGTYARAVADAARNIPGVAMLGYQSGAALADLYSHAGAFILPSSHEGQPLAVLEAASYGLQLVLSDIPAHREIAIPEARYFSVGDVARLAYQLARILAKPANELPSSIRTQIMAKHDWRLIAQRTQAIYFSTLPGERETKAMPL